MGLQADTAAQIGTLLDFYLGYQSLMDSGHARGWPSLQRRFVLLSAVPGRYAASAQVAGAATLLVLEDHREAKAAVRAGYCDFLVTQLNEALRILKNELRSGAAVSVCLTGRVPAVLSECVERGVQPDLIDNEQAELLRRGARQIVWKAALPQDQLATFWHAAGDALGRLQVLDELAREAMSPGAGDRLRWSLQAPAVLGRSWQRHRMLPMLEVEYNNLREKIAARQESLPGIEMMRDDTVIFPGGMTP